MRVALVIGMPAPYRIPVWEALGDMVGDLHVLLCAENESNRIWRDNNITSTRFQSHVLPGVHRYVMLLDWGFHWNPTLMRELRQRRPECILLHGYDTPSVLTAFAYAKWHRIPVVLLIESHSQSSRFTTGPIAALRRFLVRSADACVAHGEMGRTTLEQLGVSPERLVTGILPVDVDRVAQVVDAMRSPEPESFERPIRFLYVGQLIERKGPLQLIDAFARLPHGLGTLSILGYGPLEAAVREKLAALQLEEAALLEPTTTLEDTARVLARHDVLVMPSSREVWGLVVNEALAAGTYVLSSRYAAVTPDLVDRAPLDVGRSITPDDPDDLARSLEETARRIRANGLDRQGIATWGRSHSPAQLARSFVDAIEIAVTHKSAHHPRITQARDLRDATLNIPS